MPALAEIDELLRILQHGSREEKVAASTRLGALHAERGQWDRAAECIERNIVEGVRTPQALRALAAIRAEQGYVDEAAALLDEAWRLMEPSGRLSVYTDLVPWPVVSCHHAILVVAVLVLGTWLWLRP